MKRKTFLTGEKIDFYQILLNREIGENLHDYQTTNKEYTDLFHTVVRTNVNEKGTSL